MSHHPSSQIIHRIDTDVGRLDEVSRAMKAQRNIYVPILSLPVEVLGNVIELCAHTDPPRPMAMRRIHTPLSQIGNRAPGWLGWVRLGHICQHLRRVILEMPALWATIAFTLPRGHAEILERAHSTPLTVVFGRNQVFPHLINSAEAHLLSAKDIQANLDLLAPGSMFSPASGPPERVFTALEELELSTRSLAQDITREMIDFSPLRAHCLRHVKLRNHFLSLPFSSLETLDLHFQEPVPFRANPSQARPHFHSHALLEVLSRCTNLRRLFLRGTQLDELPAPSPSRTAIPLPLLKYLEIENTVTFCRSIWSNLVLERHACVKVTLISSHRLSGPQLQVTRAEEDAFIPTLIHRLAEPGAPSVTGVLLDCRHQDLRLALAVTRVGAFAQANKGPFSEGRVFVLDVHLRRRSQADWGSILQQSLSDLPTHIELTEVDTLSLTLPRAVNLITPEWRAWLSPFNTVRNLIVDEFPPQRGLWNALCPPAEPDDVPPALANLHTLFVLPEHPQNGFHPTAPEHLIPWEDIPAGLNRRAEREPHLERIVFGMY